mmetsp:Transcript_714/g.1053  ORF Transcript_714/g.1053 Transcript_714/m.1053 type:complete len:85 (-) Transcript_714:210-464(-)
MIKYCNPKPFLKKFTGERFRIYTKVKNIFFVGYLRSSDEWMNIQLIRSIEKLKHTTLGPVGEIFIKCTSMKLMQHIEPPLRIAN